jgi:coenzyme F420 hydrogenase subunit beta
MYLCPYVQNHKGRWIKLHDCDLPEGRCYEYCPRTEIDLDDIHRKIFGRPYEDIEIGRVKDVLMARAKSKEIRRAGQSGGVISALMDFCIKERIIDAALLTSRDDQQVPEGRIVRNSEEILSCSGSSYFVSPTLSKLNKENWEEKEQIGVVGLPCQIQALAKMKVSGIEKRTPIDRINLVIGLFCTWALDYSAFTEIIRARTKGMIKKFDMTPPPERLLKVYTDDGPLDIPIDDIRSYIRPGCSVCLDMTAEFSDISVGTAEGEEGWNTVLLRTVRGVDIFNTAIKAGVIGTKTYPREKLEHLKKASLLKKYRAIVALEQKGRLQDDYLDLSHDLIRKIVQKGKEAL